MTANDWVNRSGFEGGQVCVLLTYLHSIPLHSRTLNREQKDFRGPGLAMKMDFYVCTYKKLSGTEFNK